MQRAERSDSRQMAGLRLPGGLSPPHARLADDAHVWQSIDAVHRALDRIHIAVSGLAEIMTVIPVVVLGRVLPHQRNSSSELLVHMDRPRGGASGRRRERDGAGSGGGAHRAHACGAVLVFDVFST